MTFTQLALFLAIGALHSASLWLVTTGAQRFGVPGSVLKWMPLLLGIPTAYLAFPVAVELVMGLRLTEWESLALGACLGVPAAIGAEAVYQIAWKTIPRVVEALLGRLTNDHGG
jgi:hypothetical protein